jgi:pilus assembly protein Flp/PilA
MRNFLQRYSMGPLRRFLFEDDAATAVEYAVMLALILIAVLTAIGAVAQQAGGMWGNVEGQLNGAGFGS